MYQFLLILTEFYWCKSPYYFTIAKRAIIYLPILFWTDRAEVFIEDPDKNVWKGKSPGNAKGVKGKKVLTKAQQKEFPSPPNKADNLNGM